MGVEGFGDQVRRYRQAAGMTQEALAERSGLSVRGISDLERGLKQRPHPETVRLLAEALALDQESVASLREAANPAPRFEPSALPAPLTSLVGRDDELRAIGAMLQPGGDVRLVTLTGPGGVGKTRLAIELATAARSRFEDGVAFAALAGLSDASQVLPTLIAAFGFRDTSGRSPVDLLARQLQGKRVLAVLDNLEHLLDAVAGIHALLQACPGLMVLATSRSPLQIDGERAYRIKPLALPVVSRNLTAESVAISPAARLFMERARAVEPDFTLDDGNAPAVADVCVRLDGLPLALELAASRMNVLGPEDLAAMLGRRLDVLTGGARSLPTRHQTVRATIAWSHDLLSDAERETFRRVAVFAGGATREAVNAVIGDGDDIAALDQLSALVGRSLIQRGEGASGETRYVMLETIREFALERLTESGEESSLRDRHAAWYYRNAEQCEAASDTDHAAAVACVRADYPNLNAAFRHYIACKLAKPSQRMGRAMWWFWASSGHLRDGRDWLDLALSLNPEEVSSDRARSIMARANIAVDLSDYAAAISLYEAAHDVFVALGDEARDCQALYGISLAQLYLGEMDAAEEGFAAALDAYGRLELHADEASALLQMGHVAMVRGDNSSARKHYIHARAIRRELGDEGGVAWTNCLIGTLERLDGNIDLAGKLIDSSFAMFRQLDDTPGMATALMELGRLALDGATPAVAAERMVESLSLRERSGDAHGSVECLEEIGRAMIALGRHSVGVELCAMAMSWQEAQVMSNPPTPIRRVETSLETARLSLGTGAFDTAWKTGQMMTLERATNLATFTFEDSDSP